MAAWVGIDISKETADVAWFGRSVKRHLKVTNDDEGFKKVLKAVPEDAKFVMEATGTYYLNFALFLSENGRHVSVENPIRIKNHIRTDLHRNKDDKSDAFAMAKFGEEKNPPPWKPVTEESVRLQELAALIDIYGKQTIQLSNQIHAFSQSRFVSREALASLQRVKSRLEREKSDIKKEFLDRIRRSRGREMQIIESIPGIGESTAGRLLCAIGDFSRFSNSRQLVAYLGLSPTRRQSGTSLNTRGPISRMGGNRMRSILYFCGMSASRCNAGCMAMRERMTAKGKPGKVIIIAIVNKLVRQVFALVRDGAIYDENFTPVPLTVKTVCSLYET